MESLLTQLQNQPPLLLWAAMLVIAFGSVLLLHRFFGPAGLMVYVAVAIIGGNLQVLKITEFSLLPDPIPLGTILFSTTFLATDILNEYHGPGMARRAVFLGFAALLLFNLFMIFTVGFKPLDPADGAFAAQSRAMHDHLQAVVTPTPAILVASLVAYLVSQLNDIWVFSRLREKTRGRFLWLRNNVSTWVSALVDNAVFSVLAFVVLAPDPVAWRTLVFSYILGTYGIRVVVAVLDSPIIYLARHNVGRHGGPFAEEKPLS